MAKMTLDELVNQFRAAFGNELTAVVLFGSAAAGEHIPKHSDYNVLVVARELDAVRLRALSATARAWGEAGNPPPLVFTDREWRDSADVFPLEYADVIDRHRVLFGTLPLEGVQVSPANLRLQLEHQARGKLLALRQGVLAAGGDRKAEAQLLSSSLSTVMVIFRGVERLRGAVPSHDNVELARSVAAAARVDAESFVRVVRHVRGEARLAPVDAPAALDGFLRGLEGVVAYVDAFAAAG